MGLGPVQAGDLDNPDPAADRVHIGPLVPLDEDLVNILEELAQGLGNHSGPDPGALLHWVGLTPVEAGYLAQFPEDHLVPAPAKGQVQVGLGLVGDLSQRLTPVGNPDRQGQRSVVPAGFQADLVQN